MKIAFLILATRRHETFQVLADWFEPDLCDFYLHIDSKFPSEDFQRVANSRPNIHVIESRKDIRWGGFSMIEAEVLLIKAAIEAGEYDRFVLLSDDCLPLRAPERLLRDLSRDGEWIAAAPNSNPLVVARYEKFYMYDLPAMSPKHLPNLERGIDPTQMHELLQFAAAVARGKKPLQTLYYGSQWWALSKDAVTHFLDVYDSDEHLRASFKYSAIPDEHYIQTVIASSPRPFKILEGPVYADFRKHPKPYVFTDAASLEEPLRSSRLFVRKIADDPTGMAAAILNFARTDSRA